MGVHSQEEQALTKIQHEWAEARIKGDSLYTRRLNHLQVRLYDDTGIVVGEGIIKAHKGKQDLLGGKFVWTDTFAKQGGQWKVLASQITPVLEK